MKQYVQPVMEIDLFEENSGLILADSSCNSPDCPTNLSYGESEDPWD